VNAQTGTLKQTLGALTLGILVGIVLVTGYSLIDSWLSILFTGREAIMPPSAVAFASFLFSIEYALVIAAICVPLWLVMSKVGWDGAVAAALLGFAVTSAVWFLTNQPFLSLTHNDLAKGLCGAVAGLATWWAARRR
jgi:hypothetical protein